jgi:two-component system chemotaxis sensor kinase CheA
MLLETFRIEAEEAIGNISKDILEFEKDLPAEKHAEFIETIFRNFHSLKGAARSVNLQKIEKICQAAESVFSGLKKKEIKFTSDLLDIILQSLDVIRELVKPEVADHSNTLLNKVNEFSELLDQAAKGYVKKLEKKEFPVEEIKKQFNAEKYANAETTIRIPVETIDSLMFQIEELRSVKLTEKELIYEIVKLKDEVSSAINNLLKFKEKSKTQGNSIQIKNSENEQFNNSNQANLREFIDLFQTQLTSIGNKVRIATTTAEHNYRSADTKIENLTHSMKKVIMMPFSTLLQNIPMIVRDLSREQAKQIELKVKGDNIETDRRILSELKDPIIHLIRNCIDHGIETPEIRKQKSKPAQAILNITISQINSTTAQILISDDGAGIDLEKIRSLIKINIANPNVNYDDLTYKEILPYVFHSGISTKQVVSNISGRGLGMAIVREKVEKLGGTINIDTKKDEGTVFRINIPFNLASFHGVEVIVAGQNYMIPTTYVDKVISLPKNQIVSVENRQAVEIDGNLVSLVPLADILEISKSRQIIVSEHIPVIVLHTTVSRIAFIVDAILGEQEIMVKHMGNQLASVKNILGATILGNGKIEPVLNVSDLLSFAEQKSLISYSTMNESHEVSPSKTEVNILIAEDSITSRMMLKNILETAGYNVVAAVDGLDAYEKLPSGNFDMVISDVDMPRMSGFTLTEKIRKDHRYANVPIILVTSLDSKEDRERGIDAGASAYVVKKSFDQSNLLEIIKKIL